MILVSECSGVLVSSYPGVLGFVIQFPLFYVQVKEKRKKMDRENSACFRSVRILESVRVSSVLG